MPSPSPDEIHIEYTALFQRAGSIIQDYEARIRINSRSSENPSQWPVSSTDHAIARVLVQQMDELINQVLETEEIFKRETATDSLPEVLSRTGMLEFQQATVFKTALSLRERHEYLIAAIGPRLTTSTAQPAASLERGLPEAQDISGILAFLSSRAGSLQADCHRLRTRLREHYALAMTLERQMEGLRSEFIKQEMYWETILRNHLLPGTSILDVGGGQYRSLIGLVRTTGYPKKVIDDYVNTRKQVHTCVDEVNGAVGHWRTRGV
jgi:hypothetical protein